MPATAFFRVDASAQLGGGHLSRCLVLADRMAAEGAKAHFLCAQLDAAYEKAIASAGHPVWKLETGRSELAASAMDKDAHASDAAESRRVISACSAARRLLVIDHYRLDARWERAMRSAVDCIAVIDDLADRPHDCDVLVDQAYGADGARYAGLLPDHCSGLFGTQYALLREEFAALRARRATVDETVHGEYVVHLFFGSEDRKGNALRFAPLIARLDRVRAVSVAVSTAYAEKESLEELCRRSNGRISWCAVGTAMAAHMAACNVAIGSPGQSTWERACLGLPSAYVAIADNQVPILERLDSAGFCRYLGTDKDLGDEEFCARVARFLTDREALAAMQARSLSAVDGQGGRRVAEAILSMEIHA